MSDAGSARGAVVACGCTVVGVCSCADRVQHRARRAASKQERYQAGIAATRSGDLREALKHFDDAIVLDPSYPSTHGARGVVLAMMNNARDAEAALRAAIGFDAG